MKSRFTFLINIILLLLFQAGIALAQDVTFNRVVLPPDGVYSSAITGITQDPKGYIWFTDQFGLTRFDGYHFIHYKNAEGNTNSLAGERVECVYADADGIIWIGMLGNGLDRFDPSTGVFTHFRHDPKNPFSLSHDLVTVIFENKEGELWIGTHGGLNLLDKKTGKFIHYQHNNDDTTSLSNNQVRVIYEDHKGVLWIGTGSPWINNNGNVDMSGEGGVAGEGGLNRMDRKKGKFTRYLHDPKGPHSIAENKVRAIFEDSRGIFWVGTTGADGLQIMNRETGSFEKYPYDPSHPDKLSRSPVNKDMEFAQVSFITEGPLGFIWIGTKDAGVSRYDPVAQKTKHYDYRDSSGYNGVGAWVTYTSRDGVLWISSFSDGKLFRVGLFHKNLPYHSLNKAVLSFAEDKEKTLWICSDSSLIQIDKLNGIKHVFVHDPLNSASISTDQLSTIDIDASDNLWVGTWGNGLNRFNRTTQNFTHYGHDIKNKNSLINDTINALCADKEQNLWIGTGDGLDLMNTLSGNCWHYQHDPKDTNSLGSNLIGSIKEDKYGQLWVNCYSPSVLDKLDPKTGRAVHYFKGNAVNSIYLDNDNLIWAGTNTGLYRFDSSSALFSKILNPSTGEDFSFVYSITEDNQKNIWLATASGIIKFNYIRNECITYQKTDKNNSGNLFNSLNLFNVAYKGNDGQLFFGDYCGYYAFSPEALIKGAKPPQVLITDLRVNNQSMEPVKNGPLNEALWKAKEINLDYNQNIFSFDFIAIDYNDPAQNQVVYLLENYDNGWRLGGIDKRAYYFNVPPGKYILKIKAGNSNGLWSEKDIAVIITPPWWLTWWAYSIFAVLIAGGIWGIVYYRSLNLLKEKRVLEHKVNLRTTEVVKQKEEIALQRDNLEQTLAELKTTQNQLIQSEKMASLGELTAGIAHEIQNPLNFVNNFSEVNKELLAEMKDEIEKGNTNEVKLIADDVIENEEKINHHGKRADAIVKGMLQHSRISTGQKEPTDINALADEYLNLSYKGFRVKDKTFNATLQKDFGENIGKINIISQDIGRVLLNLFNNAFYSVSEKNKNPGDAYEAAVFLSTKRINEKIAIVVKDNGSGIPHKILDKIFQPFFTTKPTGQGTGLGLSLSYDIIKAHGGEIKVETKENEGAEFTIILPTD